MSTVPLPPGTVTIDGRDQPAELLLSAGGVEVYHADHLALLAQLRANARPDGTVCDLLWVDTPYSSKTQDGHNDGAMTANRAKDWAARPKPHRVDPRTGKDRNATDRKHATAIERYASKGPERRKLPYEPWGPRDVRAFVAAWEPVTAGWFITITDDILAPHWRHALRRAGRYVFPPLAYIASGSRNRMNGDGPPLWSCVMIYAPPTEPEAARASDLPASEWLIISRPKSGQWADAPRDESCRYPKWSTWSGWATGEARIARGAEVDGEIVPAPALPGAYVLPEGCGGAGKLAVVGGKPDRLHEDIIAQYSAPGAIVCDPCCGGGGAGAAAVKLGRRAVIGDLSREHADIAAATVRDAATYMPPAPRKEQIGLFTEEHRR